MSRLSISDNQNVIIAAHIRVSETDRCRLTFGSLGAGLDSSLNSIIMQDESAGELSSELSGSVSASAQESTGDEPAGSKHSLLMDDSVQSLGSNSSASGAVSNCLTEKESSSRQNLDNYAAVELVQGNSQSYPPELLQQQDTSELPGFSGYDPQMGYDMSYFRPMVDEAVRGPSLSASQEAETSEIWMNPRDLPSLQSASYYNLPGQTPHATYLPSHSSHTSFNAVAAQSSHLQFPGMYHPPTQPSALASPHHLGPSVGSNVGVGVAAPSPGAQVGAYQQPQLGHLNWNGNF